MLMRAACIAFLLVFSLPALAATDQEIAQKCVVGWRWVAITELEFYYLPGGEVRGIRHDPKAITTFGGTWEVKNGALNQHTEADGTAAGRVNTFPIEMLPNGLCFVTTGGHKRLMWKNGKPLGGCSFTADCRAACL